MIKGMATFGAAVALAAMLAGSASAQTAKTPAAPAPATPATPATPTPAAPTTPPATQNPSNPAALGSAYNFTAPTPGPTTCCGGTYDHGNANGNTVQIITNFNQKLAAVQLAIIEAMRLSTGQLSGNSREQTGAQHTLADQQDDRSTVKSVEQARIDAIRQATSGTTSCRIITGTRGGGGIAGTETFRGEMSKSLGDFYRSDTGPSARGTEYALQARVDVHCGSYATAADIAAGICTSSSSSMPGADLEAAQSLFYRAGSTSSTFDDERLKAAQAFAVHTVAAEPPAKMLAGEGKSPAGRVKAARRATDIARASVAQESVADFISRRTANKDTALVTWAADLATKTTGYAGQTYSGGVSQRDWLELQSRQFALGSSFLLNSDTDQVTAVKDIKNMMAIQLYQGFENYQMLERMNMNLAMQLSILVEQNQDRQSGGAQAK